MTLCEKLSIDGQIRYGYAHMTVTYTFRNPWSDAVAPRFVFPVPEDGRILGLQVLDLEGRLTRASVCSLTEENLSQSGIRLLQISPALYALLWEGMKPQEEVRLLLEVLLPLAPREHGVRLVFPLTGEKTAKDCAVTLKLYTGEAGVIAGSPSHSVELEEENGETVVAGQFTADRDFVLDCKLPHGRSEGMIQEQWTESIGIYRLRTENPKHYRGGKKQRLLLLTDCGGMEPARWRMMRELCYRLVQALPLGMPLQIVTDQPLFEDFLPAGEETLNHTLRVLSETPEVGAPWQRLKPEADTLVLVISDGKRMPKLPCNLKAHLLTLGNAAFTPLAEHWRRMEYGRHLHLYPEDVTEARVQSIMEGLLVCGTPVQVSSADGNAQELFLLSEHLQDGGYLDLAVRFTGSAPRAFQVWQDGVAKECLTAEKLVSYPHLPMAEKLYAGEKIKRLEALLTRTDPSTAVRVKQEIEQLSLQYETLCRETMLSVSDPERGTLGIPVEFGFLGNTVTPRRTIFGEYLPRLGKSEKAEDGLLLLKQSIRTNGGIYDADAMTLKERAEQTAWAVLALLTVKEKDRTWLPVIVSGEAYLKECVLGGKVGWLYGKRHALKEHRRELLDCLLPLPEEIQGVKSAAQHLLWTVTA